MARGGARQNAGRPFGTTKPKLPAEPRQQPRQIAWDSRDLEAMMEVLKRQTGRPRTREHSPFRIPEFPQSAIPKGGGMAQDSALTSSMNWGTEGWLAGQVFGGIAGEGLFFPGYAFLAELAQRPEYRLMSEIIATEATRKWIRFKSTGEDDKKGEKDGKPKDKTKAKDPDAGEERDNLAGDRAHSDEEIEAAVNEIMGTGASKSGEKTDKPGGDKVQNEKQKKIAELADYLDNGLKIRKWMMETCLHDGWFGRGHLFLDSGAESAELKTPIGNGRDATSKGKIGKGWLKSIRTIEPVWAYPQGYNAQNPLSKDWYNPQQWYVMGQEIHATRLLKFVAREVPDMLKPAYAFGGLSMSQMAQPYIDMWLQTSRSVNQLIHSFSVMVLKTDMETQTQPGGAAQLIARVAMFNQMRDNGGTYVLNKESEDFTNVSATLSGLHELQAQAQEHMAFVGRYPLLKFTGIQPSGLNASSEGELRTFYDNVHAYQEWFLRPGVQTVIDIAMITLWGAVDEDIVFEFVPLWGMSEKEEGELRKADAETDQIRIDSGVVSPEEVRKKVIADPASPYQGLDPDDVPDLQMEEMGGLMPGGKQPGGGAGAGGGGAGGTEKPGGGFPAPAKGKEPGGADSAVLPFAQDVLDAEIAFEDGEWAAYLRGRRFGGFPSRGSAASWLDHFAHFGMDAEWEEAKHPRRSDGKFGEGGATKPVTPKMSDRKHADLKAQFIDHYANGGEAHVTDVPIADLLATQETVNESGPHPENADAPIVGIRDAAGKVHIVNGHHRVEKAIAEGKTSIKARLVDDPKDAKAEQAGKTEPNESEQPIFKTKKEHAAHLLEKGTTAAELMTTLGWPSISVPAMAKSIGMKLEKIKKGKTTTYIGTPMTAAERQAANLPPEGVKRSGGPASRDPSTFSLLEFIASKGGIDPKDALIEDVRSMIGSKNKFVPGFGSLIRPGGLRLDKLREAAVESNYLQDSGFRGEGQQTSTIETLFTAVDNELRGNRVYQLGQDPEHVASEKEQAAREDSRHRIESEIDAALAGADIDPGSLTEKQRSRVIEIMEREGMTDPLEAIEREAMEWVTDAAEQGKAERILDDIEGWDVPPDAGATPEPGEHAAPF